MDIFRGIMRQFGNHVARIAAVFMIFSTGMFISAAGRLWWKPWLCMYLIKTFKNVHYRLKGFITSTLKSLAIRAI